MSLHSRASSFFTPDCKGEIAYLDFHGVSPGSSSGFWMSKLINVSSFMQNNRKGDTETIKNAICIQSVHAREANVINTTDILLLVTSQRGRCRNIAQSRHQRMMGDRAEIRTDPSIFSYSTLISERTALMSHETES